MKVLAVIPARMASTRFPGKPLAQIGGKPMVIQTAQRALQSSRVDHAVIATDHPDILKAATDHGVEAVMTREDHRSGFDRLLEVTDKLNQYDAYVNVQGDEPVISPNTIDGVISLISPPNCHLSTSAIPIRNEADYLNPNIVKTLRANDGRALIFSRSPIPHYRNGFDKREIPPLKHQGLYAYSREVLSRLKELEPSPLEMAESLEQLRFLQNGFSMCIHITEHESIGVDTPEDVALAERALSL